MCVCIVGLQELFIVSCCCPPGQTIDSNLYCQQLKRLRKAIEIKRPELINRKGVIFHHNNARHHTSLVTRQKLRAWLGSFDAFTVYSPDLAPSNYHLSAGFKRDLWKSLISFSIRTRTSSTMTGLWFYLKNGERWSIKTVHTWYDKLSLIYTKKFDFFFASKYKKLFFLRINILYSLWWSFFHDITIS